MKKATTIAIKQPCGKSWDDMQPTTSGKFCGACQKNVVDFTKFSEEQFIAYFQTYPKETNLCGRFSEKQLSISIPPKPAPITFWVAHKVAVASLIAALGFTYKADAQVKDTTYTHSIFESKPDSIAFEKLVVIKGRVLDEKGEAVPGAIIKIKGTEKATMSDVDGNFEIELPEQDARYTLLFSGLSYLTQEITVRGPAEFNVIMEENMASETYSVGAVGYDTSMDPMNGQPTSVWELISRAFKKKKS